MTLALPPRTFYLAVVAVVLLGGLAAPPHPLRAQVETAAVALEPAAPSLAAGDEIAIAVTVTGAAELYGLDIELGYDPAALAIIDADPETAGTQVALGPFLSPDFVVSHTVEEGTGRIRAIFTQLAPSEAASGDGVLLTLRVRALVDAPAPPTILGVVLARTDGIAQPAVIAGVPAEAPSSRATLTAPVATFTPTPSTAAPETTPAPAIPTTAEGGQTATAPGPEATEPPETTTAAAPPDDSVSTIESNGGGSWIVPAIISVFVLALVGGAAVLRVRRR